MSTTLHAHVCTVHMLNITFVKVNVSALIRYKLRLLIISVINVQRAVYSRV